MNCALIDAHTTHIPDVLAVVRVLLDIILFTWYSILHGASIDKSAVAGIFSTCQDVIYVDKQCRCPVRCTQIGRRS